MHVLYLDLSISTATSFIFLSNKENQKTAMSTILFFKNDQCLRDLFLFEFVPASTAEIDFVIAELTALMLGSRF